MMLPTGIFLLPQTTANLPLVNWSVLQDSKYIRNASRVNPLWVQGFPFKQLELHLPLVFSLPPYMRLWACWNNLPGKKVWTGGKNTNHPCMIAAIVTCILMTLMRLSFPSRANSRCLLKGDTSMVINIWTPSCGSWPWLVMAQAGAGTCQQEGSYRWDVYLQRQTWQDGGEDEEAHTTVEMGGPLGKLELAWGII